MQKQLFPIWYVVGALLFLLLAQSVLTVAPSHTIGYNEFKSLLRDGMVSDLVVGDQTIRGMVQR